MALGSFRFVFGASVIQAWGRSILGSAYGFGSQTVVDLFMLVALGDLLGRLPSAWLADRFGRRALIFTYGLLGAVGLLISARSTMLSGATGSAGILIAMTFGDGAFGVLHPFGTERFSTEARATGLGPGYGLGTPAQHRLDQPLLLPRS